MEKRVFLAIALMFVVLAAYDYYLVPRLTGPTPAPVAGTATTPGTAVTPVPAATPAPTQVPTAPVAKPLVADTEAHDIVVETDAVRAVFSSAGATLTSWELKKYRDATGQPFEMVPVDIPAVLPRPFTMATDDPALSAVLSTALYQPSTTHLSLGTSPGTLSFEYRDASGLNARKTYNFQPEGKPYILNVTASVDVNGASRTVTLRFGPALGLGYMPDGSRSVDTQGVLSRTEKPEKPERISASTLQGAPTQEGVFLFGGAEEQYFLSVVLPGTQAVRFDYQPISLPVKDDPKTSRKFIAYSITVPGQASLPFFLGPKEFDALHAVDPRFVYAIDFGFFRPIVVPLLQALKWINGYLGNYGWSIITLTVLINLLIFPLRHRSMVSMRKMQAAQPEIKAIQDRYAKYKLTDPEKGKQQTELMALYKAKGINPASGCVPMLLTFPILLAFYAMLSGAIELRGAPFHFWIHDLSLRDQFYITPVLMGGTMFWQQKMMPTPAADPLQQKLFLLMPLIFTVSFLWAPSGMVLYWLVSNLMGILQQSVTLKLIGAPARPAPKAPALKGPGSSGIAKL
jgi:YidC/Oxa1 family membrane protein insertase